MGCTYCEHEMEELKTDADNGYMYRWKHANVFIVACALHAKEIMTALNEVQQTPPVAKVLKDVLNEM